MDEAATHTLGQKLAAEGLGTFVLVFFGCGAAVMASGWRLRRHRAGVRPDRARDGLRRRARLRRTLQPGGVSRAAALSGRMSWRDNGLYSAVQVGSARRGRPRACSWSASSTRARRGPGRRSNQWDRGGDTDFLGGVPGRDDRHRGIRAESSWPPPTSVANGTGIPAPIAIGLALYPDALRADRFHRHVGQPGPVDRSWTVRRLGRPAAAVGLHPGAARRRRGGRARLPAIFGWDRERPVRAPRPVAAGAPQWDAQQQRWVGGSQEHGWQQPQQPWAQPDPNASQQWQQPQQPSQPSQPQQPSQPSQPAAAPAAALAAARPQRTAAALGSGRRRRSYPDSSAGGAGLTPFTPW